MVKDLFQRVVNLFLIVVLFIYVIKQIYVWANNVKQNVNWNETFNILNGINHFAIDRFICLHTLCRLMPPYTTICQATQQVYVNTPHYRVYSARALLSSHCDSSRDRRSPHQHSTIHVHCKRATQHNMHVQHCVLCSIPWPEHETHTHGTMPGWLYFHH